MFKWIPLILILNFSCTTVTIYNPHPDKNIILTHDVSQCYSKRIFKKWTAFYGAVALNKIDPNELFPTENFAYRITEEATGEDAFISFFLGLFTTISRKSIIVDFCTPPLQTTKPNISGNKEKATSQDNKEKEKNLEQESHKSSSKAINNPIYVKSNDEQLIKLLENLEKKVDNVSDLQRKLESELNELKTIEDQLNSFETLEPKIVSNSSEEVDQVIYLKGKRKIIIAGEDEVSTLDDNKIRDKSNLNLNKATKKVTLGSIFFPTNSYRLTPAAKERLQKILNSHRGKFQLIGYADIRGGNRYNYLISKRRALTVYQELTKLLGNVQVSISALGASKFKKSKSITPTELDLQRRVDIVLLAED